MVRIVFAGTPPFAAAALAALLKRGVEIPLVLTQPDRPAGRGMKLAPSAVRTLAAAHGIEVATPASLNPARGGDAAALAHARVRAAAADALVVAAYGLILPPALLALPAGLAAPTGPIRALNIHASLLPRWRGAAPIARAIEAGDPVTGITIMQMEAGLDTGPILLAESLPIDGADDAATLGARLAALGARLIVAALDAAAAGRLAATMQPAEGVTYAAKLDKREAWLDWALPAAVLARRVMAFNPFPGAATHWNGKLVKIWRAQPPASSASSPIGVSAGTVVGIADDRLLIACGAGTLLAASQLQRAGGRRLPASAFCAGSGLRAGDRFVTLADGAGDGIVPDDAVA